MGVSEKGTIDLSRLCRKYACLHPATVLREACWANFLSSLNSVPSRPLSPNISIWDHHTRIGFTFHARLLHEVGIEDMLASWRARMRPDTLNSKETIRSAVQLPSSTLVRITNRHKMICDSIALPQIVIVGVQVIAPRSKLFSTHSRR